LAEIYSKYRPNKPSEYLEIYDRFFTCHCQAVNVVLEIGAGSGACLNVWSEYFPEAKIFGIDISPNNCFEEGRISVFCGNQGDILFLERVAESAGPFDIIIDDCSHVVSHQIETFRTLFPHLRPGGIYVIEDLCTSYWSAFGGGRAVANTVEFLCEMAHGLNYGYWKTTENITQLSQAVRLRRGGTTDDYIDAKPTFFDLNVGSVHFYESLCIVTRR